MESLFSCDFKFNDYIDRCDVRNVRSCLIQPSRSTNGWPVGMWVALICLVCLMEPGRSTSRWIHGMWVSSPGVHTCLTKRYRSTSRLMHGTWGMSPICPRCSEIEIVQSTMVHTSVNEVLSGYHSVTDGFWGEQKGHAFLWSQTPLGSVIKQSNGGNGCM